ncbi:MAG: Asp-tRNA(Asn)/Glu-tRNA(Gln) amidotransferase subunit GatC [Chloroflexi bacterium]|nr:Asp-tRNA(Asn)/Glu-tRNA(Gln) amidotransferase subunit GatC [Chloroflexota bacterium]
MNDTRLTTEEVRHIATLARIGMTDADIEKMRAEMSHILQNFDVLDQVDTEGVEPTGHSVDLASVMREDRARPSRARDDMLANAPLREGPFVRVKAVLEE